MSKTLHIIILDESEEDAQNITAELRNSNLPVLTRRVATKETFEMACDEFKPDLVVSDYTLVNFDGLTAMEYIRHQLPDVPFIFVSWVIHEQSVIDTFKQGATDYIFKDQLSRLPMSVHRAMREVEERSELRLTQQKIIEQERLGAIGQMASGLAHDFSNSLMPVLGFTEILLNQPDILKDGAKVRQFLDLIHTSARDAMNIVGRLREFYRSKDKAEALQTVRLNELVRQSILLTQPRWREEKIARGIEIRVREDLREIPDIHGNETALREVMTNLIFNAVDALPKGGEIYIGTHMENHQVTLTVSDTGVGMSPEVASRCFEPFFSTKGRGGTGLGLSMVYGVMKRHEGSIEVKSERGKGTAFILRFPEKRFEPAPEVIDPGLPLTAYEKIPKLSVLIVDDEAPVREVLSGYFLLDGHLVQTACDGREGLEKFKKNEFDLVVTDRAMPEMNGDELVARIRKISYKIPVIMVTGFGELMKIKGQHPKGVDVILSKPLTLKTCRDAVARLFIPSP